MHKALIDREDFTLVERLLLTDCRAPKKEKPSYQFSGFLYCGACREQMHRRKNCGKQGERIYYICGTYNRGLGCKRHSISEKFLEENLLEQIQKHFGKEERREKGIDREKLIAFVEKIYVYDKESIEVIWHDGVSN